MTLFAWGLILILLLAVWPLIGELFFSLAGKPSMVLPFLLFYTVPAAIVALVIWLLGFAIYWWACR